MTRAHALPTIGVLGGMGPAATADFYAKLVAATPAQRDQDHLPVLIHAVPQIPDRAASFLHGAASPAPLLARFARRLQDNGADVIVMPCNTAHLWHDAVCAAVDVPVLHIVDAVLAALPMAERVGLLGTTATVRSGLYSARGAKALQWIVPGVHEQDELVDAGIRAVKSGDIASGCERLARAAKALVERGAQAVVHACTEVPLALDQVDIGVPGLDATQLLAAATVRWAFRTIG